VWAYSSTLKIEYKCSTETLVEFNGIPGVISPKMEFFITTAVGTSYSTCLSFVENWKFIVAELKRCRLN
jgi:hypothetical protein